MDKFLFLVVTVHPEVVSHFGTNEDVKRLMDDDNTAVVIRGRQVAVEHNNSIVWSEGIKQMDLVIKDNSGGRGHAHKRADHEKFFPTKMRITMVQVSKGSTYDPSLVPNLPREKSTDGGKPKVGGKTTTGAEGCCACDRSEY